MGIGPPSPSDTGGAPSIEGKIELRLGVDGQNSEALPAKPAYDFAFIDADKPSYDLYYELVLPRVRANGLIVFDNMLQHGRVVDPKDESARAIDILNKKPALIRVWNAFSSPSLMGSCSVEKFDSRR